MQCRVCVITIGKCPKEKSRTSVAHLFGVSYHSPPAAASGTVIMLIGLAESLHHHHQNTLDSAKNIQKKKKHISTSPCSKDAFRRYSFNLKPCQVLTN